MTFFFIKQKDKSSRFEYANEILITKTELEEKNRLVFNLQQQVDETKTESEYQVQEYYSCQKEGGGIVLKSFTISIPVISSG